MDTMIHLKNRLRNISLNHVCVVVLSAVIVYLFRAEDAYELRPVWRKRAHLKLYANERFPTELDLLPSPIVTDLDSDGVNEIVLITTDLKLSILALPRNDTRSKGDRILPHVVVKHRVLLASDITEDGRPSWPVAMKTGFTVPYQSIIQVRKQVIIVAMNDWQVFCFDNSLNLLWKTKLMDIGQIRDDYYLKSMMLLVIPYSIKKQDAGLVMIGGSFGHMTYQTLENGVNETLEHKRHSLESDTFTHFSTFAVSGQDGSVRWHHLPGDFGGNRSEAKPHTWSSLRDTSASLGRVEKQLEDKREETREGFTQTIQTALNSEHLVGYAYGGHRPHNPNDHVQNPNALIIHNQFGIEVLSIVSGRPITQLPLPSEYSTYVDFDSDGDIERISSIGPNDKNPCFVDVVRVHPDTESLNRISVCVTKRLFWSRSWSHEEDIYKFLPPLVIESVAKKSGIFQHLMGHRLPTSKSAYDIITVSSSGRVTSHGVDGTYHWQVQTSIAWNEISAKAVKEKGVNQDHWENFISSFQPSYSSLSLQVYGLKNALFVAGWKSIVLLDLKTGKILSMHSLPCQPTAALVIGDFDNDGWNDAIVTCKLGYIGFAMKRQPSHLYTFMYAAAVFLIIIIITWLLYAEDQVPDDAD